MLNVLTSILALPLILGQTIRMPFGQGTGFTFLDLAIITLGFLALFNLRFRLKKPPLALILALIFIAISIISLIFTPLKLNTLEYATSFAYTVRFASYLLLGWALYSGAFTNFQKNIPSALLISGITLAVLGLLQLIFIPNLEFLAKDGWDPHYFRTASTLFDPNFAGAYFVLTLILLISGILSLNKKLSVIMFLIVYFATITTFSRSVTLMFIVSFLTFAFMKRSIKIFALTFLLSLGFFTGFFVYNLAIAQPRNIDRTKSAEYRLNAWEQGLKIFESSPILGIGFNSYRFALEKQQIISPQEALSRSASGNDSSLLFAAATTGIIGFITYVVLLISIIIASFKNYMSGNKWGIILLSALTGLAVHSLFVNSLFYPWILIWVTLSSTQLNLKSKIDKRDP